MQSALYKLEDHLSYRAARSKRSFVRRRMGILSHWVGVAGDRAGRLPPALRRLLTSSHALADRWRAPNSLGGGG